MVLGVLLSLLSLNKPAVQAGDFLFRCFGSRLVLVFIASAPKAKSKSISAAEGIQYRLHGQRWLAQESRASSKQGHRP